MANFVEFRVTPFCQARFTGSFGAQCLYQVSYKLTNSTLLTLTG
jgi:hypothetical protein